MNITLNRRNTVIAITGTAAVTAAYLLGSSGAGNAAQPTTYVAPANGTPLTVAYRPTATKAVTATSVTSDTITVSGSGTVTGTPNALNVSMSVNTQAASVSDALDSANRAAQAVMDAFISHGVAKADLQTSGMSISPHQTMSGITDGYQVSESLNAEIRGLASAGATLSAAIAAGGNSVQLYGVNVALDDTSTLMADARAAAITDARTKASQFAAAAGRSVGAVVSISDNTTPPVPYYNGPMAAGSTAAGVTPVPIQAGSAQVNVQVTVVFALV